MRTVLSIAGAGLAALILALPAAAQSAGEGAFVTLLGTDTLSVETYRRDGSTLETWLAVRSPRVTLTHITAELTPDGRISRLAAERRPGAAPDRPATQASTVEFAGTDAAVTIRMGDSTRSYRTGVGAHALPMISGSYALYDQATRHAAQAGQDSLPLQLVFPGAMNPLESYVTNADGTAGVVAMFGLPARVELGEGGQLLSLDGSATTMKVMVTRTAPVDVETVARAWAVTEAEQGAVGQLSPRDTATATIGASTFSVDYGRPSKRGREIFGGVVPFGEVWRTGANAATHFTTESPIMFGTVKIQPGTYTLWTLPTRTGATLIISERTGQWGTDYTPAQDLGRIPMRVSAVPEPVELFTIMIEERGERRGALVFVWDTTRWEAPFEVE